MRITGMKLPAAGGSSRAKKKSSQDQMARLQSEVADISAEHHHKFWENDPPFKNFRAHPAGLNGAAIQVSGSSQPTPQALGYLAAEKQVGIDVDLREEPHGYISSNGTDIFAISRTNHGNWPWPGIKKAVLSGKEARLFRKAEKTGEISLVMESISKDAIPGHKEILRTPTWAAKKMVVRKTQTEQTAVDALNKTRKADGLPPMEYFRVPVTDELPPTPRAVDELARIYRHALDAGKNIHFHCEAGRGRTTTAMVLTRIMDGLSFEDALNSESNLNPVLGGLGKDLREIKTPELLQPVLVKAGALRLGTLQRFHDYWNSPDRNRMNFQDYMALHPMDRKFMEQMTGLLKIIPPKPAQN